MIVRRIASFSAAAFLLAAVIVVSAQGAVAQKGPKPPHPLQPTAQALGTVGNFSFGQPRTDTAGATGCGTNVDGEPAVRVSRTDLVVVGSERGVGGGSDAWRLANGVGGASASGCALEYRGQPNAVSGFGASGGDIDMAIASATNSAGTYTIYVSSLNLGSVSVATSTDNGTTFSQTPVQAGLPLDDREWIAAYGASTSLLTYHDIATAEIDVLRSDNGGTAYTQISQAIPPTDYKATNNELGNIQIDRRNTAGTVPGLNGAVGFWAYQSFVAPSKSSVLGGSFDEAFTAVSNDGGYTWTDKPIPCSVTGGSLDHNFPNVGVAPNGNVWETWSDDTNIYTAVSADHGSTWTCSGPISTNSAQAIFPWIAPTSNGVDLVYYASPTKTQQTWYVYFVQNSAGAASGWGTPQQLMSVHSGSVCEGGVSCTNGRQLLDDFGVDVDSLGWAHIAYSHDAPDLGGSGTYTGYAVQTAGTTVGFSN